MDIDKKIAQEGHDSNGAKKGSIAATRRICRTSKRGAKNKAKKIISRDELSWNATSLWTN